MRRRLDRFLRTPFTIMTAGLVGVIWTFARDLLVDMLGSALKSVSG